MSPKRILALVSIAAGAVLAIFFWDLHFYWFQGGPIGLVLIGLSALELFQSRQSRSGKTSPGILQELRNDVLGPQRNDVAREDSTDHETKSGTVRDDDKPDHP